MQEDIFRILQENYRKGVFKVPTTFHFAIGDINKTLTLDAEGCRIEDGKTVDKVDCVCRTSAAMLEKIWNEGYRPGFRDFMSGAVSSNSPQLLRRLLLAFGR